MTRKQFAAKVAFVAVAMLALSSSWVQTAQAIKFTIAGQDAGDARSICISHHVEADTQVVVKVKVGNGPHQKVSVEVTDDTIHQGQLWKKDNLLDELQRGAFLNKEAGNVLACFMNVLAPGYKPDPKYTRVVDVDFEIGSETIDYLKLAEKEKLKPMEVELRKLEDLVKEVIEDMEHLQRREEKMRNTNESTNARVQWLSTMTMFVLIALGAWQIVYLKQFFRKKRLID
ncbi:vesicle coat component [Linnemannia gamsii]|uniref:Vesicle coat component n=1 Tax=Linnemannia gamsii TaxID=64522 RepID=A0ABQ7K392_9FUNG|nr:vesicle coat component [Linnemannia gamsii]